MSTKEMPDSVPQPNGPMMKKVDFKTVLTFVTSMISVFMLAFIISTSRVDRVEALVADNAEDLRLFREIQVMVVTTLPGLAEDIEEIKVDVKAHAQLEH